MTRHVKRRMEAPVFGLALERLGIFANGRPNRSYEAARLVMCEGMRVAKAARVVNVRRQSIYGAMRRVEHAYDYLRICPYCGQRIPPV